MKTKFYFSIILFSIFFSGFEKVNAQTPSWVWAKGFGGVGGDFSYTISTDVSSNIYITGKFSGIVDFDPGVGTFNLTSVNSRDVFISKLDSSGNFVWARSINVNAIFYSYISSVSVDSSGNLYIIGGFEGTIDFDPGPGTYNLTSAGASDFYILKLDSSCNFIWAKRFGSIDTDSGNSLFIDHYNNIYVTGGFTGTVDFDPGGGIFNLSSSGTFSSIFILKLNSSGNFVFAKAMGGNVGAGGICISLDNIGNILTAGEFRGTTDFDPDTGTYNLIAAGTFGDEDIFISKLDSLGNFIWAKRLGGNEYDDVVSMAIDDSGNVYTAGYFNDLSDFDPGPNIYNLGASGYDIFFSKLDSSGTFVWAKQFIGPGYDFCASMIMDDSANIYTTGYFPETTDFDPDTGFLYLSTAGHNDLFVSKINRMGNLVWAKRAGGIRDDYVSSLAINSSGNLYVTGHFVSDTILFGSTAIPNSFTTSLSSDIFIAKLDTTATCSAFFSLYPDITPHNWWAVNEASGVPPMSYQWNWGDGTTASGATPSHIYNAPANYNICLTITDALGCSNTYCDSSTYLFKGSATNSIVTINVYTYFPAGIQNLNGRSLVSIYPNPATNHLTITLPNISQKVTLTITDITGKIIYNITDATTQKIEVNTKDFTGGVYFVQIRSPGFVEMKKLVVTK